MRMPWRSGGGLCMVRGCRGFTLLEILLAMVVLALVVSMIAVALSGSMQVIDATEEQGDIYYRARIAMQRISDDLGSAVLADDVDFIGTGQEEGETRRELLRFASMAHVVFVPEKQLPGMGLIRYRIVPDRDRDGMLVLLRSDRLYRPGGKSGQEVPATDWFLLCDRLRSVRFTYIDRKGQEHAQWDTRKVAGEPDRERRLPAAVTCRLEFWLDRKEETSLSFSTTVLLPAGVIHAEKTAANTR